MERAVAIRGCSGAARRASLLSVTTTTCVSGVRWASTSSKKERVVVLGSGWAGYALARTLSPKTTSRILISPRSHFVFTPLLASTSVGTLEFRAAIEPVRRLGLDEFHQAWATSVDFERKVIRVEANTTQDEAVTPTTTAASLTRTPAANGKLETEPKKGEQYEVPYDKLVMAVGCYSQTFGIEGVKEHASFLRDVGDARAIRVRVLQAFETASLPTTSDEARSKLLHFAVVGGGPTGIEFAAELHDLVHDDLAKLYPPQLMKHVSITVYDIAPKVLPMFDRNLASYATDMFRRQGIKVKTEHSIQRIRRSEGRDSHLMLRIKEEAEEVGAGVVVWSTGLMQNPLVSQVLGQAVRGTNKLAKDSKTGGLITDSRLQVQLEDFRGGKETETLPSVYALGDCAVVQDANYPATAQVASQQAVYLGKQLSKGSGGGDTASSSPPPFKFRNWGTMAYLGSWRAIHQSSADEIKGRAAWILWRTAYLTKSMSIRNKILIPVYWAITWIFGRDISRF